jgi:hypothetical protein
MKPNIRVMLVLAAALVVAGMVFRQREEIQRLRAVIGERPSLSIERAAISTATNPLPADIEELRREAAEVHRLRAEVTQLRREKVETSALQAKIDKLALDLNQRPDPIAAFGTLDPLAQSSPEEAARRIAALPPGNAQDQAALALIKHWTGADPAAAAAWVTQFAEGPLRERGLSMIAREWGLRDWNAAAGWLETLAMGASRDAAIGAFVSSADGYDIKLALEWANQTEAPDSRATRVEDIARRWLREDNAAARAWLEKAKLPEGVAERLLSAK